MGLAKLEKASHKQMLLPVKAFINKISNLEMSTNIHACLEFKDL